MSKYPRKYTVTDANGNATTHAAFSKNQAKEKYREEFGWMKVRIVSVTEGAVVTNMPQKPYVVDPPLKQKTPRNAKCPCGSGKKFKNCCSGKKDKP